MTPAQADGGRKRALITGITGQDGAYLAEFLIAKGYEVHGIKRRASLFNTSRIDHLYRDPHEADVRLFLHHGDLTDSSNLTRIIQQTRPDEIYNLGAQSHVAVSFEEPEYTADTPHHHDQRVQRARESRKQNALPHWHQRRAEKTLTDPIEDERFEVVGEPAQ